LVSTYLAGVRSAMVWTKTSLGKGSRPDRAKAPNNTILTALGLPAR